MNISVDLTKKVSAKKKVIFLSKKHLSKGSDDYLCIIAFQVSNTWYRVDIWRDRCNRRLRKILVTCINFSENNANCFTKSPLNGNISCSKHNRCLNLHILLKLLYYFYAKCVINVEFADIA